MAIWFRSMINLSEIASNTMLDALAQLMDGGSIELLSGERVLAVMKLSDPAALPAGSGELEFNKIAVEDAALAQGNAQFARVLDAFGNEVFMCDVGDENSDAVVKLTQTQIHRGAPVRLNSFRLMMP